MFQKSFFNYLKKEHLFLCVIFENNSVFLCLYEKNKNVLKIINSSNKTFDNCELSNGFIYNPTSIVSFINSFVKTEKAFCCNTILYVPTLEKETYNPIQILQLALCMSKTHVTLISLYGCKHEHSEGSCILSKNKYDYLLSLKKNYNSNSLVKWGLRSLFLTFSLSFVIFPLYNKYKIQYTKLNQQKNILQKEVLLLKKDLEKNALLEKNTIIKKKKDIIANSIKSNNLNSSLLCKVISNGIPSDTYLKSLKLKKEKLEKGKSNKVIVLHGRTKDLLSLHQFKQNLCNQAIFKNLVVKSVEKNEDKDRYNFQIEGNL